MKRYLIYITATATIALALLSLTVFKKKTASSSNESPTVRSRPTFSDASNAGTFPSQEPQTIQAEQIAVAAISPAENDPEKIATTISSLSESEVREWLEKLSMQDLSGNTARLLIRRWAELDPTVAACWVAHQGDPLVRAELTDAVAIVWSQKDLSSALAWVKSLPEDAAKQRALGSLGYEVARVDPLGAMQIATQLPTGSDSDSLLSHALAQYASVNPVEAQQLALALPPGTMRDQTVSAVATVQAEQDGGQAAKFAVENISPGLALDRAVIGVIQVWSQNDFGGASAWVQTFPDSPVRDNAMQSLDLIAWH